MAEAKRQETEMETTESYRGPVREISNVERVYGPANDNQPSRQKGNVGRAYTPDNDDNSGRGTARNNRQTTYRPSTSRRLEQTVNAAESAIPKGLALAKALKATWTIFSFGFYPYVIQLGFWFISLMGFMSLATFEESVVNYIDIFGWGSKTSQGVFFASIVVIYLIGLTTLVVAMIIYAKEKVNFLKGISLLVAAVCLALYTAPIINFVPWIALWCLYVVKSQTKD